jgi:LmbE family N-acetylglucosaminyl deacetylase
MSTRRKRTTTNSSKGASSSLEEELNPSNLLTQGEELPDPNANQRRPNHDATAAAAKAAYEAELAKLRKEADELARTKKRLLAVQQEADAAKEIQRKKAEITKLQKELRLIKAKQSLNFNQPSPEYFVPIHSTFTEGNMPFHISSVQSLLRAIFSLVSRRIKSLLKISSEEICPSQSPST